MHARVEFRVVWMSGGFDVLHVCRFEADRQISRLIDRHLGLQTDR